MDERRQRQAGGASPLILCDMATPNAVYGEAAAGQRQKRHHCLNRGLASGDTSNQLAAQLAIAMMTKAKEVRNVSILNPLTPRRVPKVAATCGATDSIEGKSAQTQGSVLGW